jgi:hypothetical protein
MGSCKVEIREIRFIIEPELTQVYIAVDAIGDCPFQLQGWHHKTFAKSVSAIQVMEMIRDGKEDHLLWPLDAPPDPNEGDLR